MIDINTLFAMAPACIDDDPCLPYADEPMPPGGLLAPRMSPPSRPPNPTPSGSARDRRRALRARRAVKVTP